MCDYLILRKKAYNFLKALQNCTEQIPSGTLGFLFMIRRPRDKLDLCCTIFAFYASCFY